MKKKAAAVQATAEVILKAGVNFTNILRAQIPKAQKIQSIRHSFLHIWDICG